MPQHDADVIVIGSGIAGLTAGALLAYAGNRVVVCEHAQGLGGYAHAFRRGDRGQYTFDPAVHLLADQQLFGGVLGLLGVRDRCTFIPSDHFYRAMFPGYAIDLPADREGYVAAHVQAFPHEADGIRRFWELCRVVHREAHDMPPAMHLRDLDAAVAAAPNLFRYRKSTVSEVLEEHVTDPRARAVCAVPWQYLGVPPSQAAFQTFAQLTTVHTDDLFAIEGGVERLIDALAEAITGRGGEIVTGCRVTGILVEDGRALGVTLADGQELRADWVLSGADPFQTFETLVAREHVPNSYLRKLSRMRVSGSAFLLFAASRLDLSGWDLPHQIFTHASWDHEESYRLTSVGEFGVRWITPTSLLDPSVAPEGEHVVPLGQARVARPGSDVTLLAYGAMVQTCLAAAEQLTAWAERADRTGAGLYTAAANQRGPLWLLLYMVPLHLVGALQQPPDQLLPLRRCGVPRRHDDDLVPLVVVGVAHQQRKTLLLHQRLRRQVLLEGPVQESHPVLRRALEQPAAHQQVPEHLLRPLPDPVHRRQGPLDLAPCRRDRRPHDHPGRPIPLRAWDARRARLLGVRSCRRRARMGARDRSAGGRRSLHAMQAGRSVANGHRPRQGDLSGHGRLHPASAPGGHPRRVRGLGARLREPLPAARRSRDRRLHAHAAARPLRPHGHEPR